MPTPNELRVFISSTFRDLTEEREHLVRKIFPEIRALCRERGIAFTEVDLRWGLTDEDVVLGQVIRTCLEEIDRCAPYFIGITGELYGYVPDLVDIYKDAELLVMYPWIEDAAMERSSIIDLEFRHAALNNSNEHARFFFRRCRRGHESDVPEEDRARLELLQNRVRDGGYEVEEFRDPASLGEAVYDALVEIIERDFAGSAPPTPLEQERARHEAFAASRRHAYIPNPEYLASLNAWYIDADAQPLIIYAESGSGKSSLVSFWCQQLRRRDPGAFIVEHYVGIGAGAVDHYAIMRHVMSEIKERFSRTEEIPSKPEELEVQFGNWLGFTLGAPMLLVIDGINQLSGRALELHWLPPMMPPGVKLIITSTVEQTLVDLRRRSWRELAMQPLKEREREGVIVRYLSEYRKALSKQQVALIAEDVKCAHPLFLRTLLEELRIDSSHERLDARIAMYLGTSGTEDLFQKVLERMEDDFGTRAVREVMSLVWCSRFGLTEEDLQALTGLSRLKLSTMLGGLDYHLVRKDGALTFFHDYLRRAAEKRYLAEERLRVDAWRRLAEHFEAQSVTLRSTQEILNALECLEDYDGALNVVAEIPRFEALFARENAYEIVRLWARSTPEQIATTIGASVRNWLADHRDDTDTWRVCGHIAKLLHNVGCWRVATELVKTQIEIAQRNRNIRAEAKALASLGNLAAAQGNFDEAEAATLRSEALGRELGDTTHVGTTVTCRGNILLFRSEYRDALECFEESERLAAASADLQSLAIAICGKGNVYQLLGDLPNAEACYRDQVSIARSLGDRHTTALGLLNHAVMIANHGQIAGCIALIEEGEALAREIGARDLVALACNLRSLAHVDRDEIGEALACNRTQEEIARSLENSNELAMALGNRGLMLSELGRLDEALASHRECVLINRRLGLRRQLSMSLSNTGFCCQMRDDWASSLALFGEAESIAREIDDRSCIALSLVGRAAAFNQIGDYEQAHRLNMEAEGMVRAIEEQPQLVTILSNRAQLHFHRGEYDAALECQRECESVVRAGSSASKLIATCMIRVDILRAQRKFGEAFDLMVEMVTRMESPASRRHAASLYKSMALVLLEQPDLSKREFPWPNVAAVTDETSLVIQRVRSLAEASSRAVASVHPVDVADLRMSLVVIRSRADVLADEGHSALSRLAEFLSKPESDDCRAEAHYWLWKLKLDPGVDHRALAEDLYVSLLLRIPKHDYRVRLDELRAVAPTETSSEARNAITD